MTKGRASRGAAGALLLALLPGAARAQANYRSAPTGGRSALMGDTGVALGRDGAAPFLNPATIVYIQDSDLTFSVNFFRFTALHVDDWHQPGTVDANLFGNARLNDASASTSRFDVVPATLCLFFTVHGFGDVTDDSYEQTGAPAVAMGRQKIALCAGNVETFNVGIPTLNFRGNTGAGEVHQAQSLTLDWSRFNIGPSYSVRLTRGFSVGLSMHAVYTTEGFVNSGASVVTGTPAGAIASNVGASGLGHSMDVAPLVGVTYRVRKYTIGASVGLPAVHLFGEYNANARSQDVNATGPNALLLTGKGDFSAPQAARLGLGVGVDYQRWKVELNQWFYVPSATSIRTNMHVDSVSVAGTGATSTSFDTSYSVRAAPVFNTSIGAEYFLNRSLSLLGGAGTDFSAAPPLRPTTAIGNFYQARLHRVGVSFGAGSYGAAGSLLLGFQASYGWGSILAINPFVVPNDYAVVSAQTYTMLFVLSGSVNASSLSRVMQNVGASAPTR